MDVLTCLVTLSHQSILTAQILPGRFPGPDLPPPIESNRRINHGEEGLHLFHPTSNFKLPISNPCHNSFRINTCKSVSKQMTLTISRMNTYEKHRGVGVLLLTRFPASACAPNGERIADQRGQAVRGALRAEYALAGLE
jgi:hypothetical protein